MADTPLIGQYPTNSYFAVRGDTGVYEEHLKKFYVCGINCSHKHQGTVWISSSTRFLYPGDTVKQRHLDLLSVFDNYATQKPTKEDEYQGELPFSTYNSIDYTAMTVVGGNGSKANWYHYWSNGLLYVHKDFSEVTVHEVFDPNESLLEGEARRRLHGLRRLGTPLGSSTTTTGPTHEPNDEPLDKPDDDDNVPMPSLFSDDSDSEGMGDLFG